MKPTYVVIHPIRARHQDDHSLSRPSARHRCEHASVASRPHLADSPALARYHPMTGEHVPCSELARILVVRSVWEALGKLSRARPELD
jgi:hypothetical protein